MTCWLKTLNFDLGPTFGTRKMHWEDGSDPMCPKVRNRCFTTQARLVVELALVTQIRTQNLLVVSLFVFCLIEIHKKH